MIVIPLDNRRVALRWATPRDGDLLAAGFQRLSAESRRMRFFSAMPRMPDSVKRSLLSIEPPRHFAVVAFDMDTLDDTSHSPFEAAIGVARLIAIPQRAGTSEFAMTVVDEFQHHGLGHLLFELLLVAADHVGIHTIEADVLTENGAMSALLHHYGSLSSHPTHDYSTTHMSVAVAPNLSAISAERRAAFDELIQLERRLTRVAPSDC